MVIFSLTNLKMFKFIIKKLYENIFCEYIEETKKSIENINAELLALKKELLHDDLNKKLLNKYPSKYITYHGRALPGSTQRINVPVSVLITPTDPIIIRDLKLWGLYQSKEDIETLIPKIYENYMKTHYQYKYDKDNWNGLNELWEFPFELYGKYGRSNKWPADCDSHAIALVSYMRCAGISAGYVWVVVGNCMLGGHATFYAYGKDKKFHHLNSTSRTYKKNVSDYPTHQDAENEKDLFGIYNVWLSFNDLVARSEFNKKQIENIIISK